MPQAQILALVIPVVMGLLGLFKPLLEQTALPVNSPLHDPVLRILAVLMSVVGAVVVYLVQTPNANALGLWSTVAAGLVVGLTAMGLYSAATGQLTVGSKPKVQDEPMPPVPGIQTFGGANPPVPQ